MSVQGYQPSNVRSILLGLIISAILLVMLCSLSSVVKFTGAALLFIPEKLGLVQQVSRDQVISFGSSSRQTKLVFSGPGTFALYTSDYDLLVATSSLESSNAKPWLVVTQDDTGKKINVNYVRRGLRPYDTPLASGRPIFTFDIPAQGTYTLVHPTGKAQAFLVPDYTTGNESLIVLLYAIQIAVVGYPLGRAFYRRYQARQVQVATWRNEARARGDTLFRTVRGEKEGDSEELWHSKL